MGGGDAGVGPAVGGGSGSGVRRQRGDRVSSCWQGDPPHGYGKAGARAARAGSAPSPPPRACAPGRRRRRGSAAARGAARLRAAPPRAARRHCQVNSEARVEPALGRRSRGGWEGEGEPARCREQWCERELLSLGVEGFLCGACPLSRRQARRRLAPLLQSGRRARGGGMRHAAALACVSPRPRACRRQARKPARPRA